MAQRNTALPRPSFIALSLGIGMALLCGPASALYKVVGPDGKVSYTDRPDTTGSGKVSSVSPKGPATGSGEAVPSASASLPAALRQVAAKFPVVLYVSTPDCEPCNSGRQFLQQRGIPYAERTVTTNDDVEALQRITGGKAAPTLSIGGQVLAGFSTTEWGQYLDAAGYPGASALPAGWKASVTPLTPPRTTTLSPAPRTVGAPGPAPQPPAAAPAVPAAAANPPGIRF